MIGKKHLMAAAFALLAVTALPSAAKADGLHISFGPVAPAPQVVYVAPRPVVQQPVEYVTAYPQPYYYPVYYYQPAPPFSFGWHHHDHHHDRD